MNNEVRIDSQKVINYLRKQIDELQFQNTILKIQLEEAEKKIKEQEENK